MYYYYNETTLEATWSYPAKDLSVLQAQPVYGPSVPTPESTKAAREPILAPLGNYGYGRTNMMMWRSDLGMQPSESTSFIMLYFLFLHVGN